METRSAQSVVGVDDGRFQLRRDGDRPGAYNWALREHKISVLATAAITGFDADHEPNLPDSFRK